MNYWLLIELGILLLFLLIGFLLNPFFGKKIQPLEKRNKSYSEMENKSDKKKRSTISYLGIIVCILIWVLYINSAVTGGFDELGGIFCLLLLFPILITAPFLMSLIGNLFKNDLFLVGVISLILGFFIIFVSLSNQSFATLLFISPLLLIMGILFIIKDFLKFLRKNSK